MRRYDDPVEVRRGMVSGPGGRQEGPEQFLWRGRLWKVCDVVAHWVETGAWWQSSGAHAVLGMEDPINSKGHEGHEGHEDHQETEGPAGSGGSLRTSIDLSAEREVWRVEAARGLAAASGSGVGTGVFDLTFDWADGSWQLTRCAD